MRAFADKDFLLTNETAKTLYHNYAADMPIIDYHCHVNPKEIAKDRRFNNITELWLNGDHYKWRLMRANGEDEKNITGDGSDYDKFMAFAKTLPKAIGNPVYHWAHLELQRYFNCNLTINSENADKIWEICSKRLADSDMSVRGIIKQSNVDVIVTTDDPVDTLQWHKQIADDKSFKTKVLPGIRPDKAVNIDKPGFIEYIKTLADAANTQIKSLGDLFNALTNRFDFFENMGCITSDHGLDYVPFAQNSEDAAPAIFIKALRGEALSSIEIEQYKTALMLFFGRRFAARGWTMQLHYGALRSINPPMFNSLGPDTGFDAISTYDCSSNIASLLAALQKTNELPKVILYSLNPNDDAMLVTIAGCFPGKDIISKTQHGSAWWFNDTKQGMEAQITALASRGLLGGFIGMLTDSRSFVSYTRHEYFRRILCNLIGQWVSAGEYPNDIELLGSIVQDISHNNVKKYIGF